MRTYTYAIESIRTGTVTVTVPDDKTLEEVWLEAMNFLAEHNLNELPGISMDSEEDVTEIGRAHVCSSHSLLSRIPSSA